MNALTGPASVVERQLTAYNDHDLESFTDTYAEDVCITYPDGSLLQGRQAVREAYAGQFTEGRCHAEVTGRLTEGDWVVDHETAHGIAAEPLRVLVAYRIRGGRIDRVEFLG
ncbi:nuclear transport factor 2 family protein [Streptomyces sp. NBC_01077]|uniref:nuclear transport factor 2 family protein n=1 Tax=Streptomyces sp. NBC_01077 TaxID=2903746 RepID=UPI00386C5D46|nr:nuclear transport factor 2 family protein [Streptomyces sp. NBC_01077]WSV43768.1 nuclear transport factor 2 family protein [Streptomyces sp. NBC_01077]